MPPSDIRLFADTNITALAVRRLREAGFDVVYAGERAVDPGDVALLEVAQVSGRVLITKDHDIGALVFRDGKGHAGVLLIDDLGNAEAESGLLLKELADCAGELANRAFVRKP